MTIATITITESPEISTYAKLNNSHTAKQFNYLARKLTKSKEIETNGKPRIFIAPTTT